MSVRREQSQLVVQNLPTGGMVEGLNKYRRGHFRVLPESVRVILAEPPIAMETPAQGDACSEPRCAVHTDAHVEPRTAVHDDGHDSGTHSSATSNVREDTEARSDVRSDDAPAAHGEQEARNEGAPPTHGVSELDARETLPEHTVLKQVARAPSALGKLNMQVLLRLCAAHGIASAGIRSKAGLRAVLEANGVKKV